MNQVILIGNVGNAPEIKAIGNTGKVANFSVATTKRWAEKDGTKKEKTDWHKVVAWGSLATLVEKHVGRGKQVAVTGEISYRKWEDESGVTHDVTEIVADSIELLGGKKENA